MPFLLLAATLAAADPSFEPAKTWAVIAGVLEWKDPGFSSFSKESRKDRELFELLGKRGVPSGQRVLLLDGEATADAITAALKKMIASAPADATLVFYYAGHGVKNDGNVIFASADISGSNYGGTGLHLDGLVPLLSAFKGAQLWLLADCCYSGGLGGVAKALKEKGVKTVALTSADASNTSTGNWTFTQTLIDAFNGRDLHDLDEGGTVSLDELQRCVQDAMKHRESQRYGYSNFGVPEELVLAKAVPAKEKLSPGSGAIARRSWVMANNGKQTEPARVLGLRGEKVVVAFYDYATETTRELPASKVQPLSFKNWPKGASVDVTWGGKVYEAKVLEVDGAFHFITYPGWASSWDEWVAADRIVGPHDPKAKAATSKIQVEWQGKWWDAVVTGKKGSKTCIHYIGYNDSWDECVDPARVRAPP